MSRYEDDPFYRLVISRPIPMKLAQAIYDGYDLAPWHLRVLEAMSRLGVEKRAAEDLGISHDSVKTALAQARMRLGARNTTHAVAIAIRRGLI